MRSLVTVRGLLLGVALAALGIGAQPAASQPAQPRLSGRVIGRIVGAAPGQAAGAKVVLVQFKLDPQGVPQGAPIQTQPADAQGGYEFKQVPIEPRAVYKIGANVGDRLVSSQPFTFPADKRVVQLDLHLPKLVTDPGALRFSQALLAFEPAVGSLLATEVLHVGNPTPDTVELGNAPLELSVPSGAKDLKFIREDQEGARHTLIGTKLLVYGRIQPGDSTLAFTYRIAAALGSIEIDKRYPLAVDEMLVLAPQGSLKIGSEQLKPGPMRQIEGNRFDTWNGEHIPARQAVLVRAWGIPLRQELVLIPLVGFFTVMAGVLVWFFRKRLGRPMTSAVKRT
jgi:hypothetical protein